MLAKTIVCHSKNERGSHMVTHRILISLSNLRFRCTIFVTAVVENDNNYMNIHIFQGNGETQLKSGGEY